MLPFAQAGDGHEDSEPFRPFDSAQPGPLDGMGSPNRSPTVGPANITIEPITDATAAPQTVDAPAMLPPVYFVRHRRARRYLIRVESDGRLRVTIPRGGSRREAAAFAERSRDWIAQQRTRLASQPARLTSDERAVSTARALEELPQRLRQLAAIHEITGLTRVSIRDQRTRWGSCGRDGHICLNWRLVLMPDRVRDYVLIHELMHLRRMDHSPAYWQLVEAACPAYEEARAWIRTHGRALR